MSDLPVPQLSIKEQRERTVALLCEHYAQDRLELADFEARLDIAHRATTGAELTPLLQDLPTQSAPARPSTQRSSEDMIARASDRLRTEARDTRVLVAIMGGVERSGQWQPRRRNILITFMGGAELDFRDVVLPPGETQVFVACGMGGAEIIVPPDLAVDASGIAIAGGFAHTAPHQAVSPDAPVLRVTGFCIMGGLEITVRLPGETAREAKVRRRAETRELRRGRSE
jgi:hypothetical protein